MKQLLIFLSISLLLLACEGKKHPPEDSASKWNPGDIKGRVKSIIAINYQSTTIPGEEANEPLETDVTLQVYNTKGKLSESHWYDSDSMLVQKMLFEYNLDGLLIRNDYIDYQRDVQNIDSSYFIFTYNSYGKPEKEEIYHNGKLNSWTEITYNGDGDVLLYQSFRDGQKVDETKYEYRYNSDRRKIEEKYFTNGALRLTANWEYDSNGKTIAVKTKDGDVTFTETYSYDSKGRLIKEVLTPNNSGMKRISSYQYDEQDNMVEFMQQTEEGYILRNSCYTYDERGNWIRSAEEVGSSLIICERKIEYYD